MRPSTTDGRPALGSTRSAGRECCERWRRCSVISAGPVAQLRPKTSGFIATKAARAAPISVPSSIRPVSLHRHLHLDRHLAARRPPWRDGADHRGLGLQAGRTGLDEEQVDATLEETTGHAPRTRRAASANDTWPSEGSLVPGPIEPATHESSVGLVVVSDAGRDACRREADLVGSVLQPVLGEHGGERAEGVRLDDVDADVEEGRVQVLRPCRDG